jgi:peptidoglycan/xylan/chitin deacetylase (PgdA/CDA1 family)
VRQVAITIDDGPSRNTAEVLAIFERLGVRCTFFYVGNRVPRYRVLARQAYRSGFEIGDHTWNHLEIKNESLAFDLGEIDRCATELQSVTGHRPVFMRPPAGHWDPTGLRAVTERNMVMALWSLHGHDTGPGTHADVIARGVLESARGGDVILLHETNPETVKALPVIIEGLRRKGLEPVTLSQLLASR